MADPETDEERPAPPQSAGGKARAEALSATARSSIARKAAKAKWAAKNDLPVATHGAPEKPLHIGEVEIPCYVLADGRRVLVRSAMIAALDMKPGSFHTGADRLSRFACP